MKSMLFKDPTYNRCHTTRDLVKLLSYLLNKNLIFTITISRIESSLNYTNMKYYVLKQFLK